MGAGVGKPQEAPRSSRNSNSGNHQNQSRTAQNELSDEMSCEGCSIRFSLLKRKKPCCECLKNHCSACLIKSPATNGVRRRCQKCQLLVSGRFTRHDLTDYKAKDLRQFLIRRNVPVTNCTEKSDLVELLLKFNNSSQYRLEQELSNRRTQELQERSRYQDQVSEHDSAQPVPNVSDNTSASNTPIHASTNSHSTQNPEEAFPDPPSYHDVTSGVLHQGSGEAETGEPTIVVEQDQNPDIEINVDGDDPSDNNTPQPVRRERARIENVPSLEAIDDLTVKQLKEILAMNFVNYKGCVEKWELVDRVKRLWQDTKDNQKKAEEIESKEYASSHQASGTGAVSGESELCKICMECVIDCVLLECGHMVTCTQCGKRMSECPICRQYVIRVVHVFKS